jgi:hypothetical protein
MSRTDETTPAYNGFSLLVQLCLSKSSGCELEEVAVGSRNSCDDQLGVLGSECGDYLNVEVRSLAGGEVGKIVEELLRSGTTSALALDEREVIGGTHV